MKVQENSCQTFDYTAVGCSGNKLKTNTGASDFNMFVTRHERRIDSKPSHSCVSTVVSLSDDYTLFLSPENAVFGWQFFTLRSIFKRVLMGRGHLELQKQFSIEINA